MAKRKKAHGKRGIGKVRHHHRRRIGAIDSHGLMDDAITMGGLVVGQLASTALQRKLTTMNPKLVGVVQVAAGILIKRNVDHPFMKAIGWGIAGAGAMHVAHDAGIIHGIDGALDGFGDWPGSPFRRHHGHGCHPHYRGQHHGQRIMSEGAAHAMHGLNNFPMMSGDDGMSGYDDGMSGYEQMNGGIAGLSNFDTLGVAPESENWMKSAFQNVQPLGA